MHFDIIFLDICANKYFDPIVLDKHPLGGTEATVVRVAEALGSVNLLVGVIQSKCEEFEPIMGKYAYYMHINKLPDNLTCDHYIQIRRNHNSQLFPEAKKYLWMHDLAAADHGFTYEELKGMTVLGVSRWHKKNIQKFIPFLTNVDYVYNPVPNECYLSKPHDYDKNLLVWLSSPHKGLGKALEIFKRVRAVEPKMKLMIYNPGYLHIDQYKIAQESNIYYQGPVPAKEAWGTVKKALAVFYPCQWDETFGMIASESNALRTPVLAYNRGALGEILTDSQLVDKDDEDKFIEKILAWNTQGKPDVTGKLEFMTQTVLIKWLKILGYSLVAG